MILILKIEVNKYTSESLYLYQSFAEDLYGISQVYSVYLQLEATWIVHKSVNP